jgi:hypothetical protein
MIPSRAWPPIDGCVFSRYWENPQASSITGWEGGHENDQWLEQVHLPVMGPGL